MCHAALKTLCVRFRSSGTPAAGLGLPLDRMVFSGALDTLPLGFVTRRLHSCVNTLPATRHKSQVPRRMVSALYNAYNMLELNLGSHELPAPSLAISQERVDADAFRRRDWYCATLKALHARFWQPRTSTTPVSPGVLSHSPLWTPKSPDRDYTTTAPRPAAQAGPT
ncbi:hypothetical protein VTO73DRAFT_15582 [Trametes versicolor]